MIEKTETSFISITHVQFKFNYFWFVLLSREFFYLSQKNEMECKTLCAYEYCAFCSSTKAYGRPTSCAEVKLKWNRNDQIGLVDLWARKQQPKHEQDKR